MSKIKISRLIILDIVLVIFWAAVLLFELFFTQEIIWIVVALVCTFAFSALLGRDIRKQRAQ